MIEIQGKVFALHTNNTTYLFRISEGGHPEHIYYGARLKTYDVDALALKNEITFGSTVEYSPELPNYSLDTRLLEYSGIGKGDYRHAPLEILMPDGTFVTDFVYASHEIVDGAFVTESELPFAKGEAKTLLLTLKEKKFENITLTLHYTVFEDADVITRGATLHTEEENPLYIRKLMSFMLDLPTGEYEMTTIDGAWAKETHLHTRPITRGIFVNDSTVGASSNLHNCAFLLKAKNASEEHGDVYGFNLIYSGNHYSAVELSHHGTVRVMSGISPHCFLWKLSRGEDFVTPEAVMTYSKDGISGMTVQMHTFVNRHIIREEYQNTERPIVLNNWEATFFHFNRRKILALAKRAKSLGIEMFVLDDGWFGKRNSDTAGLGDWVANTKKLPGGIPALAEKIEKMGMKFGLWFEPECVNPDSDLYRAHPDWAIAIPDREASLGRNQMTLDLTRPEVRDYIVDAVDRVLSTAKISYVKWDYNRHISDMYSATLMQQGEFFHRYILGLYEVFRRIFLEKHPDILFESCSSGGNRFDLGMLCFSPQIWTSDDTDARERIDIQRGVATFYPLSTISAHVSMTPNMQTLRNAPLSTRFNVACFGVLGYELDFDELTPDERRHIKEQIAFYKAHRKTFQYGTYRAVTLREGERLSFQVKGEGEHIVSVFNLSYSAIPERDTLRVPDVDTNAVYTVKNVKQYLRIGNFGNLIKHITPVRLRADGFIVRTVDRHYSMVDGEEEYTVQGENLCHGLPLAMQYSGTGYLPSLRILGDNGSTLYHIKKATSERTSDQ